MPQMYPMMWTWLYMLFTISLIFFLVLLYFTKTSKPTMKHSPINKPPLNWQW